MFRTIYTTPLPFLGAMPSNTNLDDYTNIGIYFFSYNNKPAGLPSDAYGNGWLIVLPAGSSGYAKQIWIALGHDKLSVLRNDIYIRGQFSDDGWAEWDQVFPSVNRDINTAPNFSNMEEFTAFVDSLATPREYTYYVTNTTAQNIGVDKRFGFITVKAISSSVTKCTFEPTTAGGKKYELQKYSGAWDETWTEV